MLPSCVPLYRDIQVIIVLTWKRGHYSCLFLPWQAQQVHSMFPHIPLQAITLNLADTHSVSLTVEHILNDTIYIPGQDDDPSPSPLSPHTNPPLSSPPSTQASANSIPSELDSDSTSSDSSTSVSSVLNNGVTDSIPSELDSDSTSSDSSTSVSSVLNNGVTDSGGDVPGVPEEVTADVEGGGEDGESSAERKTPDILGVETEDSSSTTVEATTVEAVHTAGNCTHQHRDSATANTVRHRNVDRGGTSSSPGEQSCSEGKLQTACSFGVDSTETISREFDHVTAPRDSQISVSNTSAERQDVSSSSEMNICTDDDGQGAVSPSPLSTPSPSPYSFASLQQRKQKLLLNAKRY